MKTPIGRLIEECASHENEECWAEFVRRFGSTVRGALCWTLSRLGVALPCDVIDELVQDVYCRLLADRGRPLRSFQGGHETQVRAFLARIARSVVFDHLRRLGAQRRPRLSQPEDVEAVRTWLMDDRPTPEERVLRREQRLLVWRRVRRVASKRRPLRRRNLGILRLALLEGWSSQEISRDLGGELSPSGVDSIIARARQRLAEEEGVRLPSRQDPARVADGNM